jgi:glycosyltransferase involved in cell wall biosynthesis
MKILFVAARWDPKDPDSGSGLDYNAYITLKKYWPDIKIVGPFKSDQNLLERGVDKLSRLITKKRFLKFYPSYIRLSNRIVQKAIESYQPDLIFSKSSIPLINVEFSCSFLYMTDSSIEWVKKQWPYFTDLGFAIMQKWERKVIDKASHILTFSEANGDVLKDFYQKPAEQVTVHPVPSSLPHKQCGFVEKTLDPTKPIRLILVGRAFHRKGVDIAMEVTQMLNNYGIPTQLRVVGQDGPSSEHIQFMGLYSKNEPETQAQYLENYRWAHFHMFPSRFDTAGITPSEAAGFGVPTITNAAGGLATTVKDGVSGIVLPENSPASRYVDVIKGYVEHPQSYHALRQTTYQRYQLELTWDALGEVFVSIIDKLV